LPTVAGFGMAAGVMQDANLRPTLPALLLGGRAATGVC
jgi:hypothetical protein